MNVQRMLIVVLVAVIELGLPYVLPATQTGVKAKNRIAVVSSYHREYLWSQETNAGLVAALLKWGYLDNESQAEQYTRSDYVESSQAIIKKLWMDTKRKNSQEEIDYTVRWIVSELEQFQPDILLLGDDNAANYIGNQYIDSQLPVVFWGVNGSPLKYGLLDSVDRPGHNVTGIYQAGYLKEALIALKKMLPHIQSLAVLSDDSPTGRSKLKELERYSREGGLPIKIIETVMTNSVEVWKSKALELKDKVDAFFVSNHSTLKDSHGRPVDTMEVGAWYLQHILKPDIGNMKHFVQEGILCAIDDSGFKQGYEAMAVAHRILANGEKPAEIPAYAPEPGQFVINLERAEMLGLKDIVAKDRQVGERIPKAMALDKYRQSP